MPFGKKYMLQKRERERKTQVEKKKVRPHTYTSVTAVVVHAGEL